METQNEIQRIEPTSPLAAAAALIQQSDGKIDVDKLEALLRVQMQWEANEAKKAYVVAMAAFKVNPPEIIKDKTVSFKQTSYRHASLYNVTTKINSALSLQGLTASWVTSQDNGSVKVTCRITHVAGHSEETSLSAPPDTSGSKNAIQAIASTVTYLERYTLFALTGLAGKDQDDDGNAAGKPTATIAKPTKQEQEVIDAICKKIPTPDGKRVDVKKVLAIIFAEYQKYPSDMKYADSQAKWLSGMNKPELFIPENRGQFEIDNDMPGDEDSVPDGPAAKEAEETAAAKFGKETEKEEVRWRCLACEREFSHRNKNHKCPHCFSDKLEDRKKRVDPAEVPLGNSEGSQCQSTQG